MIAENLQTIRDEIAALSNGRPVKLLAVSKTKPYSDLLEAYEANQRDFGENYANELFEKCPEALVSMPEAVFHMIGPVQSSRIPKLAALSNLHYVHSVDRLKIAELFSKQCEKLDRELNVFVQVNTSSEESKSGCSPEEALDLCLKVESLERIKLVGLMTIGAPGDDSCLDLLKKIFDDVKKELKHPENFTELSMGMSGDMAAAIERGSTIVRVGSAIFGARYYPAKN